NESQQNIFAQMLSVESSEIPKDPCTDREKSPTSPFILVTPFDVDRGRSLVKSVSFILANCEKSSTNRENSLVRTAHTETSILTTFTSSVTPIKDECYLMVKEFNYTMNALDGKVNAIYKLCRYIRDQQQKSIQDTQNVAKSD
ncbi:23196_t:CDS:2, partial [Rhizophagus irregularis]